ncbi:MAG: hypothetical protein MJD61_14275 [Proteobacteria bacterium]|nr:hypothetical protein [Pseudomonadota bacterium]
MTLESGNSSRTFKSALIWAVAEDRAPLAEEARKFLAWKDIEADIVELRLGETQQRQLVEHVKRAERDLREAVWRTYKNIFLLAEDNSLRRIDLGLVHSSAAGSLVELVISRLRQEDIVVEGVSPNFLGRYWPPALPEWSTKAVRDAFYASPKFPRLLKPDAVKETISRGLDGGVFAYVGRAADGDYEPFVYKASLRYDDVEIAADVYLIARERAEEYVAKTSQPASVAGKTGTGDSGDAPTQTGGSPVGGQPVTQPGGPTGGSPVTSTGGSTPVSEPPPGAEIAGFSWVGEVPTQKWMNFYTKVLSRFATAGGLKLTVTVDVALAGGLGMSKVEETKVALRELGMDEDVKVKLKA